MAVYRQKLMVYANHFLSVLFLIAFAKGVINRVEIVQTIIITKKDIGLII